MSDEFDEEAAYTAGYEFSKRHGPSSAATKNEITQDFREGARYQHSQNRATLSAMKSELAMAKESELEEYKETAAYQIENAKLRAENATLRETLSYLPKVPTQPYERQLAKELVEIRSENIELQTELDDTRKSWNIEVVENEHKQLEIETLEVENTELKWFTEQLNKYVLPGQIHIQDSALKVFKNLNDKITALNSENSKIKLIISGKTFSYSEEFEALRAENAEFKIQLKNLNLRFSHLQGVNTENGTSVREMKAKLSAANAQMEKMAEALVFYSRVEKPDDFQNRYNKSNDYIECQVSYKGESKGKKALADFEQFKKDLK